MTDKEKLDKVVKLSDAMYYAAQFLTTDASRLHKAMDEYHKFIIHECKEEPVSIDFEQELYKAFGQVKDFTLGMRIAKWFYDMGKNSQEPVSEELEEAAESYSRRNNSKWHRDNPYSSQKLAFKAGAQWQREKYLSNIDIDAIWGELVCRGVERLSRADVEEFVERLKEGKYDRH